LKEEYIRSIQLRIDELKQRGLYRKLRTVEGEQSHRVLVEGREVIQFSSNNYLGLASHPRLKEKVVKIIEQYGCGSGASRLVSGNLNLYEQLEVKLARFKNTPSALVFNSGYMANLGVIPSLMQEGDVIFSDELNHASIIDACRMSRAEVSIFRHRDADDLERLMKSKRGGKRLIVTDGVFSMEGDIAPLPDLAWIGERYSALLMVDDAHATGVLGKRGSGTVEHFGLNGKVDIQMGTLSKALGGFGAYIAGDHALRDYLINMARSFIFTTALPPAVLASSIAALEVIENEPELKERLWENVRFFKPRVQELGFQITGTETPIIPIIIGDPNLSVEMARMLLDEGVWIQAIRPPAVPEGTSRLRIALMATHTVEELETALRALEKVGKKLRVI
jgi:predicted pyridoxal phosphate-dependent acyltransferase